MSRRLHMVCFNKSNATRAEHTYPSEVPAFFPGFYGVRVSQYMYLVCSVLHVIVSLFVLFMFIIVFSVLRSSNLSYIISVLWNNAADSVVCGGCYLTNLKKTLIEPLHSTKSVS